MREKVEKLTVQAGEILMRYFKKPDLHIIRKGDGSPVTEADYAASDFLIKELEPLGIPVITEERQLATIPQGDFFIIDPLDGTQYFIDQEPHFAVLVALISGGKPIMGFSYFPVTQMLFSAEQGRGSFLNGQKIKNEQTRKALVAYSSGFHLKPQAQHFLKALNIQDIRQQESILKMCNMAKGDADFYPRFGPTYEWDTGSGQILLEEGGCRVLDVQTLEPLTYGKKDYLNHGFICFRQDLEAQVRELFANFSWKKEPHGPRHKD
jgi:3'(2'), 5'-bisphosphate nucleotidase